jgi:glycine betaine/choline ABC-type transport system substrate-binding protein
MQKRTIIKRIKAIIENIGVTTNADMELGSSPVFNSIGEHTCQLVERYGHHKVDVVTYVHDNETDEDYVSYEDLEKELLEEILFNLENYEVDLDKTLERSK